MNSQASTSRTKASNAVTVGINTKTVAFAALAACLAFTAAPARADIITSLVGSPVADGSGGYFFTYTAALAGTQYAQPVANGDNPAVGPAFGTVYDFGPIIGSITATGLLATDFVFTTSLTNTPAVGTSPTDNGSTNNIRFTDTLFDIGPNTSLGTFTVDSALGPNTVLSYFDGQAAKDVPGQQSNNTLTGNIGMTSVPVASPPVPVPEPFSLSLLGMGLLGAASLRRRKAGQRAKAV